MSSSRKHGPMSLKSIQQLVQSLTTHRVNTLTELCRIEQIAASCDNEADGLAFQEPMTLAWSYYVTSNQLLSELRGLTPNYPFSADVLLDARQRVLADPLSDRSWNMAWLCLVKMRDDAMLPYYAALEAAKPGMWTSVNEHGGGPVLHEPQQAELDMLAGCFEYEWTMAVTALLRHWSTPPTWF